MSFEVVKEFESKIADFYVIGTICSFRLDITNDRR